jgi:hypothetical protein
VKPGFTGKDQGGAQGDSPVPEDIPDPFSRGPIGVFIRDDADPGTGIIGMDDTGNFLQGILFQTERLSFLGGP